MYACTCVRTYKHTHPHTYVHAHIGVQHLTASEAPEGRRTRRGAQPREAGRGAADPPPGPAVVAAPHGVRRAGQARAPARGAAPERPGGPGVRTSSTRASQIEHFSATGSKATISSSICMCMVTTCRKAWPSLTSLLGITSITFTWRASRTGMHRTSSFVSACLFFPELETYRYC